MRSRDWWATRPAFLCSLVLERVLCAMADMDDYDSLFRQVDGIDDAVEVGLVAVQDLAELCIFRRSNTTLWEFFETEDSLFQAVVPAIGTLGFGSFDIQIDRFEIE